MGFRLQPAFSCPAGVRRRTREWAFLPVGLPFYPATCCVKAASPDDGGPLGAPVSDRHRPPPAGEHVLAARTDGAASCSGAISPGGSTWLRPSGPRAGQRPALQASGSSGRVGSASVKHFHARRGCAEGHANGRFSRWGLPFYPASCCVNAASPDDVPLHSKWPGRKGAPPGETPIRVSFCAPPPGMKMLAGAGTPYDLMAHRLGAPVSDRHAARRAATTYCPRAKWRWNTTPRHPCVQQVRVRPPEAGGAGQRPALQAVLVIGGGCVYTATGWVGREPPPGETPIRVSFCAPRRA